MQNSERQPFEQGWRSAFDGAEMSTSDAVWTSIEMKLVSGEADQMKRRVVFYQRLAAATVLFALLSGAVTVYNYRATKDIASTTGSPTISRPGAAQPAQVQSTPGVTSSTQSPAAPALAQGPGAEIAQPSVRKGSKSNDNTLNNGTTDGSSTNSLFIAPSEDRQVADAGSPGLNAVKELEDESTDTHNRPETVAQVSEQPVAEPVVADILSADQFNAVLAARITEEKDEDQKEEFARAPWLGVGGAAGSYNTSPSMGGAAMDQATYGNSKSSYADAKGIPQSVHEQVGSAYSAGVSAGLKLSRRWVVQTGINFVSQQVDYSTSFVGVSASNRATPMTAEFFSSSDVDGVMTTNSYAVSNNTQVLSVPVQAGYVIVDRKFGWQVNTGVSTDFFLQSTLEDKSGGMEKISEGSGDDSPFRAVNWSGLLNTELSYQIGDHYKLAVVPGMRYMFKPILKDDTGSPPLIVDLGFRLNYMFN
jgi:hypothetical protein